MGRIHSLPLRSMRQGYEVCRRSFTRESDKARQSVVSQSTSRKVLYNVWYMTSGLEAEVVWLFIVVAQAPHSVYNLLLISLIWGDAWPIRAAFSQGQGVCVCVCVSTKKHACLRLTARKSPRKHSLQLLHWIYSPMKTFSVLASLVRAANPWLSKATCPCKSTYGIVGVSPNLLSMSMSSLSLTCTVPQSQGVVVFIARVCVH